MCDDDVSEVFFKVEKNNNILQPWARYFLEKKDKKTLNNFIKK